jgi:hypothetical protein
MKDMVDLLNESFKPTLSVRHLYAHGRLYAREYDQDEKYYSAFYDSESDSWTIWCGCYNLCYNDVAKDAEQEIITYLEQEGITCHFDYSIPVTISVRAKMTKDVYIMPKSISDGVKIIPVPE